MKRIWMMLLVLLLLGSAVTVAAAQEPPTAFAAVQATSISINQTAATVSRGETFRLKLRGTKQAVVWKTTDKTVAAVDKAGVVTAKAKGKAAVYTKLDGVTYRCVVRVEAPRLSKKALTLIVGQRVTLTLDGTARRVKWQSSDPAVAKVTKTGLVAAKAKGKAVVTATVGKTSFTCAVRVEAPKLSNKALALTVGDTAALKLAGTTKRVKWRSTNDAVATVENGVVTALGAGTAKIVAKVGGQKFICKVTVTERPVRSRLVKADYTDTGDGIIAVLTNENSRAVCVTLTVRYYDADGVLVDKEQSTIDPLGTGRTAAVRVFGAYDEYHWTTLDYASYTVQLKAVPSEIGNDALLDDAITVKSEEGANELSVTVCNTGDRDCGFLKLAVLYCDERGTPVGYEDSFVYGANAGATDTVTFAYPNDVPPTEEHPLTWQVFVNYAY